MAYEYNHYYELKNTATGQFVNLSGSHASGAVRNGETVNLFAHTDDPDQRWALERYDSNGGVRIVVQRGEGWYAMNYHTNNGSCIVWHLNSADDCDTVIRPIPAETESEYYLMLRDRDLYLTASNTTLKWLNYTGSAEQRFSILEPQGSGENAGGEVSLIPDSPLVDQFIPAYEGNYTKDRAQQGGTISEITVHHCAGNTSIESLGALWQREGRNGSSHYGINGSQIGQYVHECDVAWTNSNWDANCRAVTIETANSAGEPNWPVSDASLATLKKLVADIAKRNGLGKLVRGVNLTWHQMYAATACPGPYLLGKIDEIVRDANAINGY